METIIEILIDASGSMGYMKGTEHENSYLIDGHTRMSIVKRILVEQIITTLEYANRIFLRTFRSNQNTINGKTDEKPHITSHYQGVFNKDKLLSLINNLPDPNPGGTPISKALETALKDMSHYKNADRKIILLTDGEENGGGNYIEVAKKIESLDGIPCKIFVIGLAQTDEAAKKMKQLASGGYVNITSKSYNPIVIQDALRPLQKVILEDSKINYYSDQSKLSVENNSPKKIETITEKLNTLKNDKRNASTSLFEDLETKLSEHLEATQKLIQEFSYIKEFFRIDSILNSGLDSTTLTIDDSYSQEIRKKSEDYIYKKLCEKHGVRNVNWLNQNGESFSQHDFEVLNDKGEILNIIECKGTPLEKRTFYLTKDEWHHFLKNKNNYQLYRVYNLNTTVNHIYFESLFDALIEGKIVPYLLKPEILKDGRVFLTIID